MTEEEAEELEIVASTELVTIIKDARLEPDLANEFRINFEEHFKMANEWSKKAKTIIVTNENQTVLMEQARVARLFIRSKRLEIENFRKSKKEYYLRGGQAVDKVCTFLKNMIEPIENHLDLQEHYIEYKKKAEDTRLLAEAQAKAEADRIENERLQAVEMARLRKEAADHEKALASERTKQEAILAKERAIQEAQLVKERAERAKVEEELRKKRQAEMKAEADRIKAEERAKSAGDNDKLIALHKAIAAIHIPEVKSKESIRMVENAKSYLAMALKSIIIQEEE